MSRKKSVQKMKTAHRGKRAAHPSRPENSSRTSLIGKPPLLNASPPKAETAKAAPIPETRTASPRILMVMDQFNVGGTETYILSLTKELLRQGTSVVVAGKKGRILDSFVGLGCPCYEIDFVLDHFELDQSSWRKHLELLKSIIVSERIDLVHGHQVPSGQIALQAAAEMNVPFVFTVHGTYYEEPFLRKLHGGASLISVSPAVHNLLAKKGIPSLLIPNGIHIHDQGIPSITYKEYTRERLGLPIGAKVVMYAGRLTWEKAEICSDILRAVCEMNLVPTRNVYLMIAGGGLRQSDIERQIEEIHHAFKSNSIVYCGEVLNIHSYYHASDVVIGTGRIALEAMSCGSPFIAVGSKGEVGIVRPEVYSEAWNNWFGDHGAKQMWSVGRISNQIQEALSMNDKDRMHLVQRNKQWVANHFHITPITKKINDLYRSLIYKTPEIEPIAVSMNG
ncbi:glycosyltransferase [Marinicrinis lubricantis]|uniref:Glycosyltransferase n=1 Tax=Marinicrinis lubricantis TaxID=2086470 RepID=A0ABW1IKX2_9BACL